MGFGGAVLLAFRGNGGPCDAAGCPEVHESTASSVACGERSNGNQWTTLIRRLTMFHRLPRQTFSGILLCVSVSATATSYLHERLWGPDPLGKTQDPPKPVARNSSVKTRAIVA
jgi:hypothetical protein